ncbi:LOW QUALITY PROTEIN: hypothetical protein V2J09_022787, partial [Rumex salicifolius]
KLFHKGRICILASSTWILRLLEEFYATPTTGHSGAWRTYKRISANIYWPDMFKEVQKFVVTIPPAGLLQPLSTPQQVWEDVSLDFIGRSPKSLGFDCVLLLIGSPSIAISCYRGIRTRLKAWLSCLHEFPRSMVSDRDPLSCLLNKKTKLKMSSAYHLESDGQTEVLNRYLETYQRCYSVDQLKQWAKWMPWAEYWYKTNFHGAAGMTPFEKEASGYSTASSGGTCGGCRAEEFWNRDEILRQLKFNLDRTRKRVTKATNKKRRELEFRKGDLVFLNLRPHHQANRIKCVNQKLAARFYDPFRVLKKIGAVAYKLDLPPSSKIHPVFHVSLLKKVIGEHPTVTDTTRFSGRGGRVQTWRYFESLSLSGQGKACHKVLIMWEGGIVQWRVVLLALIVRRWPHTSSTLGGPKIGEDQRQDRRGDVLGIHERIRRVLLVTEITEPLCLSFTHFLIREKFLWNRTTLLRLPTISWLRLLTNTLLEWILRIFQPSIPYN